MSDPRHTTENGKQQLFCHIENSFLNLFKLPTRYFTRSLLRLVLKVSDRTYPRRELRFWFFFYCFLDFNTLACYNFEELPFRCTWKFLGVEAELMTWLVVSGIIQFMNYLKPNVPGFYVFFSNKTYFQILLWS